MKTLEDFKRADMVKEFNGIFTGLGDALFQGKAVYKTKLAQMTDTEV